MPRFLFIIFACALAAGCADTYEDGLEDGCAWGHLYGREHGLQAGASCATDYELEVPWDAYTADDDSYEAGLDDGYADCYWVAFDCAYGEADDECEAASPRDPYSDECRATWPELPKTLRSRTTADGSGQ